MSKNHKNKTFKKRKIYQIILLVLSIVCIILLILAFLNFKIQSKQTDDDTPIKNNSLYEAPNRMTDYQKELYDELTAVCNKLENKNLEEENLEELASIVTKNFIADYFSWANKRGSYDVGGVDYVYGPYHMNFSYNAREYFYYELDLLMKEYGSENLPLVSDITITSCEKQQQKYQVLINEYDYSTNTEQQVPYYYDAYLVTANWQYTLPNTSKFNINDLPDHGNFMLILRDGRLEIGYFHENYIRELDNE